MQCACILRARDLIADNVRGAPGQKPDYLGLTFGFHAFLSAGAGISKFVNPASTQGDDEGEEAFRFRIDRGKALRKRLKITDRSPILSRSVRNGLGRMDEYLDVWVTEQPRPTADQVESGDWPQAPDKPQMPVRIVDGPNLRITFNGKTVEVEKVATEAQRIADRIPGDLNSTPLLALLRRLGPFPKELRLDAATRRPHEPVTSGAVPIGGLDRPARGPSADEIDDADAPRQDGTAANGPDG